MTLRREPVFPPLDGSVIIPESIDFNWQHNADLPMFAYETDGSSNVTEITFLEFGRACHRVARLVRPGRLGPDQEIVAFIALADTIVYQAVTVGLMIAGLVVSTSTSHCLIRKLNKCSKSHFLFLLAILLLLSFIF